MRQIKARQQNITFINLTTLETVVNIFSSKVKKQRLPNLKFIIFTGTGTGSEYAQVQNYNFAQRLQGAPRAYLTIDGVRNRSYESKVAKNSTGTIKVYCEADSVQ